MKMTFFKKYVAAFLIVSVLTVGMPQPVHAGVWGENLAAATYKLLADQLALLFQQISGTVVKLVSTKSLLAISQDVLTEGESPKYIKNYRKFLNDLPDLYAKEASERLLTDLMSGRTSGNYSATTQGAKDYYRDRLYYIGLEAIGVGISKETKHATGVDLEEYCDISKTGSPDLYRTGDKFTFNCFGSILSNPMNHPFGITASAETLYNQQKEILKDVAKGYTEGSGVLPTVNKDGDVQNTAAQIEQFMKKSIDTPIDILLNANDDNPFGALLLQVFTAKALKKFDKFIKDESDGYEKIFRSKVEDAKQTVENLSGPVSLTLP